MALYCADVPSTHRVLSLKSWRRVEYEEHYTPSTPWEKFGTGISDAQIYCIWQPGGWINIKHNKNKNYIIITQTIDRWAISDNYLGHKDRRMSKERQLCQPFARYKLSELESWRGGLNRAVKLHPASGICFSVDSRITCAIFRMFVFALYDVR